MQKWLLKTGTITSTLLRALAIQHSVKFSTISEWKIRIKMPNTGSHRNTTHTLTGTGSTALVAAVPCPGKATQISHKGQRIEKERKEQTDRQKNTTYKPFKTHKESIGYWVPARWNSGNARDNVRHTVSQALPFICNQSLLFRLGTPVLWIAWLIAFSLPLKRAGRLHRKFITVARKRKHHICPEHCPFGHLMYYA